MNRVQAEKLEARIQREAPTCRVILQHMESPYCVRNGQHRGCSWEVGVQDKKSGTTQFFWSYEQWKTHRSKFEHQPQLL